METVETLIAIFIIETKQGLTNKSQLQKQAERKKRETVEVFNLK